MQRLACQIRQIPAASTPNFLHPNAHATHASQPLAGNIVFASRFKIHRNCPCTTHRKALLIDVARHLQTRFNQRQKIQAAHTHITNMHWLVKKTYTCLPQVALSFSIRSLLSTSSLSGFRPFMALLARAFSFAVCSWTFLVSFVY